MKQVFVFAKLGCTSSTQTQARLLEFLRSGDGAAVELFVERLVGSRRPPLLYMCQLLDYWSSGFAFNKLGEFCEIVSCQAPRNALEIAVLPADNYGKLGKFLEGFQVQYQEDRWFARALSDARSAWDGLGGDSVLLIARIWLGSLVTDDEVKASFAEPFVEELIRAQ
jgi:hypothetical protein